MDESRCRIPPAFNGCLNAFDSQVWRRASVNGFIYLYPEGTWHRLYNRPRTVRVRRGRFQRGRRGNPQGHPAGTPNRMTRGLKEIVLEALDRAGGVVYLEQVPGHTRRCL